MAQRANTLPQGGDLLLVRTNLAACPSIGRGGVRFIATRPRVLSYAPYMSVGFKEWTLICDAITRGDQSIIIRKGGLHEGTNGFRFDHEEFLLFPTFFHEQVSRLKLPSDTPLPQPVPGQITIRAMARCVRAEVVSDLDKLHALAPFHIWSPETIEDRFRYITPGAELAGSCVHVAFLRIYQLSRPWVFPDEPEYGGCRSWLTLPEMPADIRLVPVLEEAAHNERIREIRSVL